MTRTILGICATLLLAGAALIVSPASAENWQTVDVTQNGTIFEIDMDSIMHSDDGSARVTTSTGAGEHLMFFDCKGHWGLSARVQLAHIPHLSVAEEIASVVCADVPDENDASPARPTWGQILKRKH